MLPGGITAVAGMLHCISCTAASSLLTTPRGMILGTEALPHLLNKRWCTVPNTPLGESYQWELQCRHTVPGSPMTLKIFTRNGVELQRTARCPSFLPNYISLQSPNLQVLLLCIPVLS